MFFTSIEHPIKCLAFIQPRFFSRARLTEISRTLSPAEGSEGKTQRRYSPRSSLMQSAIPFRPPYAGISDSAILRESVLSAKRRTRMPVSSLSKTTLSPGRTPRIAALRSHCDLPLLVILACFCMDRCLSLLSKMSLHAAELRDQRRRHRLAAERSSAEELPRAHNINNLGHFATFARARHLIFKMIAL